MPDNWGIEAWAYSTNANNPAPAGGDVAFNGNYAAAGGMGLFQFGTQWQGLISGIAWIGTGAAVVPNTWTHLAIVTTGGATTFYVNGVANYTASFSPAPPTSIGDFSIGYDAHPYAGRPSYFQGLIDEVRIFTFEPGDFTTDDLLLTNVPPAPEPAAIAAGPTAAPGTQIAVNSALSLSVLAGGTAPIQYQWWNGTNKVSGATNATLSFSAVTTNTAGSYTVVVSNAYGPAATSAPVDITVVVPSLTGGVIPVAYYRLGENDPGAADGQTGDTNTIDLISGLNLSQIGNTSTYSTNAGVRGSTLSLAVDQGGYYYPTPIITNAGNWGLEAWVMSTNADNAAPEHGDVVINGNYAGNTGLGIFQIGSQWQALIMGIEWFGGAPVATNKWTHLAVVTTGGATTFYVNGVANATVSVVPNPPTTDAGDFSIGYDANPYAGQPSYFQGFIDEVRAFTVAPGLFSTNALLASFPPPPASVSILAAGGGALEKGGNVVLVWSTGLWSAANLQQADSLLGPWTTVTNATAPWIAPVSGVSQFFRLAGQQ